MRKLEIFVFFFGIISTISVKCKTFVPVLGAEAGGGGDGGYNQEM